ncbi:5-(carboxyamino)imidazole ribonucleotide mutase [Candidatus Eisenbacteria bacterium]|uniref:N5-carboxyaminoimidazole ribonucleotide mutase n=1 Tax=Eiseniibacteriota bacterium TaxID=2212470 RepID=A0ABV6YPZ3_UNCEI
MGKPEVAVLMGSKSDAEVMERAGGVLDRFGVEYSTHVLSAHRTPEKTRDFARDARKKGFKVIIAGAGMAAHLAGAVASETTLPVIGVPLAGSAVGGLDALLATVQMPTGVPVATVAIGGSGAHNAAVLAIEILALSDAGLRKKLIAYKKELAGGAR